LSVTPTTTYVANNPYYQINTTASATKTGAGESTRQTKETDSASGDRVTFSKDLCTARTREAMGLNPTGKLKLKDFETVAEDRRELVSSTLTQTMKSLGIELDQEISFSVDSKNKILISGDFPEKSKLEEALNEDEEFTTALTQLSANQSILDYVSQLRYSTQDIRANMANFFNSDTASDDLNALVAKYESLKSSDNSMQTLLSLSSSQNPYSYTYTPDEKAG
jgi:hypothetical protein